MATQEDIRLAKLRQQFLEAAYAARRRYLDGFKKQPELSAHVSFLPATW